MGIMLSQIEREGWQGRYDDVVEEVNLR